jgi:glycine betaine/proline transport system ATP-binding protein
MVQLGRPADLLLRPADDYVTSFVRDVSRLQVLRLEDIMTSTSTAPDSFKKAVSIDRKTTLEKCLIDLGPGQNHIIVTGFQGKTVGHFTRDHLLQIANSEESK